MKKKQFLHLTPQKNQPINGFKETELSPDDHGITLDDGMILKSQIMLRMQYLEKQNKGLKDIIEQRKKEIDDIITANKKYISVLAHDLKSPFSTIYGVLGMLKDSIHEGNFEEMEEYIDIASSSALNTTNLIENILAWVHSQNKNKQISPVKINLANLVNREIASSSLAVKLKKISLSHSISQQLFVRADLQMTQSIFRNMITNAIKFTPPGGNITLSAIEANPFIEIRVIDDGIGISVQNQQELFEESSLEMISGKNYTKEKGIGLILCKEFVEIHGGTIRVESIQGEGSNFIFTLPAFN